MMRIAILGAFLVAAAPPSAETVFATKTIRAKEVVSASDVRIDSSDISGGVTRLEEVVGAELKRAVYAGRPILQANVTKPALVERNQVVRTRFIRNGLQVETEARALQRGSAGDVIQAMNLTSRKTIQATVTRDGQLKVLQ